MCIDSQKDKCHIFYIMNFVQFSDHRLHKILLHIYKNIEKDTSKEEWRQNSVYH